MDMRKPQQPDTYTKEEAQRRFEQALKGALKTPHKPQSSEAKRPRVNRDCMKVDKTRNK
jgi:hypothetical protein